MEYSELLVEKVGRVGVLTLNRPPKNSFSKKLLKEMLTVLEEFEKDDDVRTVFLKSTGEHFSRGADADDIKKASFIDKEMLKNYPIDDFHRVYICEIENVLVKKQGKS